MTASSHNFRHNTSARTEYGVSIGRGATIIACINIILSLSILAGFFWGWAELKAGRARIEALNLRYIEILSLRKSDFSQKLQGMLDSISNKEAACRELCEKALSGEKKANELRKQIESKKQECNDSESRLNALTEEIAVGQVELVVRQYLNPELYDINSADVLSFPLHCPDGMHFSRESYLEDNAAYRQKWKSLNCTCERVEVTKSYHGHYEASAWYSCELVSLKGDLLSQFCRNEFKIKEIEEGKLRIFSIKKNILVKSLVESAGSLTQSRENRSDLDPLIARMQALKCKHADSALYQNRLLTLLPMIRDGADVNITLPETEGNTALHYSCAIGSLSITKWLLEHGANPNAVTDKGTTPLQCVGSDNGIAIRNLLIQHGAQSSGTQTCSVPSLSDDRSGLDPLIARMQALKCKHADSALYQKRLLTLLPMIRDGADVNITLPETKGNTALHYSCAIGSLSITKWLLEHGANPNAVTDKGATPLQCVGSDNGTAIRNLLKQYGATR